jgi:hypothetical protein
MKTRAGLFPFLTIPIPLELITDLVSGSPVWLLKQYLISQSFFLSLD